MGQDTNGIMIEATTPTTSSGGPVNIGKIRRFELEMGISRKGLLGRWLLIWGSSYMLAHTRGAFDFLENSFELHSILHGGS